LYAQKKTWNGRLAVGLYVGICAVLVGGHDSRTTPHRLCSWWTTMCVSHGSRTTLSVCGHMCSIGGGDPLGDLGTFCLMCLGDLGIPYIHPKYISTFCLVYVGDLGIPYIHPKYIPTFCLVCLGDLGIPYIHPKYISTFCLVCLGDLGIPWIHPKHIATFFSRVCRGSRDTPDTS